MASVVNVPNDDYIIKVQPGGTITLDTGSGSGEVVFTGNYTVAGTQTNINSEELNIADNIITVNSGETGLGVTLNESGIRIDRGQKVDATMVFNETISFTDPVTDTLVQGVFQFKTTSNSIMGIQTNSINTNGGDLNLINAGTGVISVTGTNNYEDNLTDDDHIPNKKYVDDEIVTALTSTFQRRIEEGTTNKSFVEVRDQEVSGVQSVINFTLDAVNVGQVFADRFEYGDLRLQDNMIETTASDTPLILASPGTAGVEIRDNMTLTISTDPSQPADGIKLYAKAPATGGTGLFFKHSSGADNEIISRKNALLLSMLF